MKIRNLLILGLVLVGFTYCSSDEVLDGPAGNEAASNLKMEIAIKMPTGATTRSSTDGSKGDKPTVEVGTVEENQANTVLVVLYQDGAFKAMYDSRDAGNSANPTNPTTPVTGGAFITTAEFNIQGMKAGDQFDVYAFVNPYDGLSEVLKATFPSKEDLATTIDAVTNGKTKRDNFFMSSDEKVTTEKLTAAHIGGKSPSEALQVAVNVQRAVARMDVTNGLKDGNTEFKIENSDVKVKFTGYKLMNTSKAFYNFKHISVSGVATDAELGSAETNTNYVVDNDWPSKAVDGFFNYMGTATTSSVGAYNALDVKSYVTENTSPADVAINGIKGHTTAVVFKGYLDLTGATYAGVTTANEDVYVWNNKFYGVYSKLPETIRNKFTATPTATELAEAGVTGYSHDGKGYPVYYVYYNRHNDNGEKDKTGPMEFAVVRNNIYKLTINSLSKFGHPNDPELTPTYPDYNPDPTPQDPKDPIESSTLYIQVTATVLDWTVRTNAIEF